MSLNVREIEREGESGESRDEQQTVGAKKCQRAHENVAGDAESGDGDSGKHSVGAVIDDAAVPVLVDVAGSIAVFAVVFAQGEGRNDDTEQGQDCLLYTSDAADE